jgi:hypothetical protein
MALFNVHDLLGNEKKTEIIQCDFFSLPEGVDCPTITLEISDKVRETYRVADDKYRFGISYKFKKGQKTPDIDVANDPVQFCHEILNAGYEDSEGLIDEPSKKAVLALLRREPTFARRLAAKLVEIFEHDDLYQEEEDDEKN